MIFEATLYVHWTSLHIFCKSNYKLMLLVADKIRRLSQRLCKKESFPCEPTSGEPIGSNIAAKRSQKTN